MFWKISSFPKCEHHAFLSHCQEDRESLVLPVQQELDARGVVTWLDQEDYYGRPSRAAVRDGLLRSRHAVFFVTEAMLTSARGWCVLELALAELLELNLQHAGGGLAHVVLPLFLVGQGDGRLPRSVWKATRDRGNFYDGSGDTVAWCAGQILQFLTREQSLSREFVRAARTDPFLAGSLAAVPGLHDRVTKFEPRRLR